MEPWLPGEKIDFLELTRALNTLEVSRESRKLLAVMLCTYRNHKGHMLWKENSLGILKDLLCDIIGISSKEIENVTNGNNPEALRLYVASKTKGFELEELDEICNVLGRDYDGI